MSDKRPSQPLPPTAYVLISLAGLVGVFGVGWYLLSNPGLIAQSQTAARSYYFLLIFLGLAAAAFLYGAMHSRASVSGNHFGVASEFGGPAAVAIAVVAGGFYLTKAPLDFTLTVRLRASEPIVDTTDTWVRIDLGPRRDERAFSKDGEASFNGIPSKYLDESLPIELISKTFRLKDQSTNYKVPASGILYLEVVKAPQAAIKIEVSNRIVISHLLGDPVTSFGIKAVNVSGKPIELSDLSLDLTSPTNKRSSLILSMVTPSQRSNEMSQPPPNWKIFPGETLSLYLWWARLPWNALGASQAQLVKQLPEYSSPNRYPCWNETTISDDAVSVVLKDFEQAFVWEAGRWNFEIAGVLDGRSINVGFAVDLSEADVRGMKAVTSLYKYCQGINTSGMFVSNGAAQTLVDKPRREVKSGGAAAD